MTPPVPQSDFSRKTLVTNPLGRGMTPADRVRRKQSLQVGTRAGTVLTDAEMRCQGHRELGVGRIVRELALLLVDKGPARGLCYAPNLTTTVPDMVLHDASCAAVFTWRHGLPLMSLDNNS